MADSHDSGRSKAYMIAVERGSVIRELQFWGSELVSGERKKPDW